MRSSVIFSAAALTAATLLAGGCQTPAYQSAAADPEPVLMDNAPRAGAVSVMILPFRLIGNPGEGAWISQAIDEDLRVELLRNPSVNLVAAPAALPATPAEAIAAGRGAGATYVVYGSYQFVNGQLRVTGSIYNTSDGSVIAPLSATGDMQNLFHMEDSLAAQVQHVLPAPPAAPENAAPQTTYNNDYYPPAPPDYEYAEPDYGYYPALPYGYYDDGLIFAGIGVYGGGFYGGRPFGYSHFGNRGAFRGSAGRGFSAPRSGGFGGGGFHGVGGFGGGGFHGGGHR